jgi:hypothetical protein
MGARMRTAMVAIAQRGVKMVAIGSSSVWRTQSPAIWFPFTEGEIPMASRGARAGGKPKGGKKGKPPMSGGKKGALPKADKGGY